jgi:hypothetical protein
MVNRAKQEGRPAVDHSYFHTMASTPVAYAPATICRR